MATNLKAILDAILRCVKKIHALRGTLNFTGSPHCMVSF